MEPRPIEPQDIRVGMRVRRTFTHESGHISTDEFTVRAVNGGAIDFEDHAGFAADHRAAWTLLADAPEPERSAVTHWRDRGTGAEYVIDIDGDAVLVAGDRSSNPYLIGRADDDLARLTPIPATCDRPHLPDDAESRVLRALGHTRNCGDAETVMREVIAELGWKAGDPR